MAGSLAGSTINNAQQTWLGQAGVPRRAAELRKAEAVHGELNKEKEAAEWWASWAPGGAWLVELPTVSWVEFRVPKGESIPTNHRCSFWKLQI